MAPSKEIPALLGGSPIRPEGPPDWPMPDEQILHALNRCWRDGSWGKYHGGNIERLEQQLRNYHQVKHALTCASGTFAVETALRGLRVGSGNEVILAAYDYPGNFHSIHAVGAFPVLVDIAAHNWNLLPEKVAEAIGPKTRAVIVSHLHGGLAPMQELLNLTVKHGLAVIEDAAQCPGALVNGKKAGTWGDVGVLSFGGSKLLSAGRGGAILTNRDDIHQRMRTSLIRGNHICPLSELQAAVLAPQLEQLDERNCRRWANVELLKELLLDVPGLRPFDNPSAIGSPGYYKVGFQFDEKQFGLARDLFIDALRAEGVAFDKGFRALHIGRSRKRYRSAKALTEADKAHRATVILHHPILLGDEKDIEQITAAVIKTYRYREKLLESALPRD